MRNRYAKVPAVVPLCRCGCGQEVPLGRMLYASTKCNARAQDRKRKARDRALAAQRTAARMEGARLMAWIDRTQDQARTAMRRYQASGHPLAMSLAAVVDALDEVRDDTVIG